VQEQFEAAPMHLVALGEGQRLAHKRPQPLAQGVVAALDMGCLTASLPRRDRLRRRDHRPLGFPEVCVAGRLAPGRGHLFPHKTAAFFAALPQATGDGLPRFAVQRHPDPSRFGFRAHQGPPLVPLQNGSCAGGGQRHGFAQGRQRSGFFLSQLVRVWREMPQGRLRARRLERSC
jgi:hypothetical protein